MRVPIAYLLNGLPTFAVWEQNSVAAWIGFCDLMMLLKAAAPGQLPKLPLVSSTGHRQMKLGNGITLVPMFKPLRFVPRPPCLPDEDAVAQPAGDAWGVSLAAPAAGPPDGHKMSTTAQTADDTTAWPTPAVLADSDLLIDDELPR
jgi:hypothetical protein